MIIINIEIKKHYRLIAFYHQLHNALEDLMFELIMKLPDRFIPASLMNWLDHYTSKRINQLKQQQIKQTWKHMYLSNALKEISDNKTKAPSEE